MEQLQGFDFFPLEFDEDGKLTSQSTWTELKQRAAAAPATDAIFLAHGFRNDENDAHHLYSEFLRTFRLNMARPGVAPALASRRFIVGGVFWPSKKFSESFGDGGTQSADADAAQLAIARAQLAELRAIVVDPEKQKTLDEAEALLPGLDENPDAQDKFVRLVLSVVDEPEPDPNEGLQNVRSTAGSVLLDKLALPIILPTRPPDEGGALSIDDGSFDGEGSTQGITGFFGSVFGRVGQFLNLTTWYVMKNRSGVVGANGVAACVRELRQAQPGLRVHLVGHSLGGRLMAGCAKSIAQSPAVTAHSLTLLEAAFSHYGLSADNLKGNVGFFRDAISGHAITGPMVATFSMQDTVVGKAYAIASRLAGDNTKAVGDANDPFGGIGRNGAQNLKESAFQKLNTAGNAYTLTTGVVHSLDGSGGLITSHGDVTNENVTWAFASVVAATP